MPSESKVQRRFFGFLYKHPEEAAKRGIKMSHEQIRDFAATSEKGLPERAPTRKRKPYGSE
jgi:hypothetical protein